VPDEYMSQQGGYQDSQNFRKLRRNFVSRNYHITETPLLLFLS
jgi:hypothetical protein